MIAPAEAGLPLKGVVAVVIGNWLEFYDFLVFTFFAVMIGVLLLVPHGEVVRERAASQVAHA